MREYAVQGWEKRRKSMQNRRIEKRGGEERTLGDYAVQGFK
jgi:hypothetical protein